MAVVRKTTNVDTHKLFTMLERLSSGWMIQASSVHLTRIFTVRYRLEIQKVYGFPLVIGRILAYHLMELEIGNGP